jgi:hypothetical protein
MRVYPKVSGLDAWSENSKWYISLPPGAVKVKKVKGKVVPVL